MPERRATAVECPTCTYFWVDDRSLDDGFNFLGERTQELTKPRRALLSHLLRSGKEVPTIDTKIDGRPVVPLVSYEFIEKLLRDEFELPNPLEQSRKLLRLIGDLERELGEPTETRPYFAAEIGAPGMDYVIQYIEELRASGLLNDKLKITPDNSAAIFLSLTLEGWKEWTEIGRGHRAGDRGFIAMQFGDEKLDVFVESVIKPGVQKRLGLVVERVDDNPEAGVIDNRMRQLIQDAAFVIADLTHGNNGAYWEAGYAEGLGKPVIYLCEKSVFEETKPHFDVNHSMTVMWSEETPEETIDLLCATIRNSLPRQ
jgi:hypothetical protein